MKKLSIVILALIFCSELVFSQNKLAGLRGDKEAIAEAEAMVETMGGLKIWEQMKSIHFVHEWFFWNRVDSYVENEILDLTEARSWIEMKSEIYFRLRGISPEHGYWNVVNGEFSLNSKEQLEAWVEGFPFHIVRIAKAIAIGDPFYEVRLGEGEFPGSHKLEFYGPDGKLGGWIVLNVKNEPVVWGVPRFKYTFGPMKRFGNLRMPDWAVTGNGGVFYQMISLSGTNQPPDSSLFVPPKQFLKNEDK